MQARTPTHRPPWNANGLPAGATQRWRRLTSVKNHRSSGLPTRSLVFSGMPWCAHPRRCCHLWNNFRRDCPTLPAYFGMRAVGPKRPSFKALPGTRSAPGSWMRHAALLRRSARTRRQPASIATTPRIAPTLGQGIAEPVQSTVPNEGPSRTRGRCYAAVPARSACRNGAVRQRVASRSGPFLRLIIVNAFLKWWVTA